MDVRGTPDRTEANNKLSQLNRDQIRIESAEGKPKAKGLQVTPSDATSEVARLLQELRALPEVREEIVQTAIQKLQSGDYSNRESAEQTAEAILGMLDTDSDR